MAAPTWPDVASAQSCAPVRPVPVWLSIVFLNDTPPTEIYTLSLHDALPIYGVLGIGEAQVGEDHRVRLTLPEGHGQSRLGAEEPIVEVGAISACSEVGDLFGRQVPGAQIGRAHV